MVLKPIRAPKEIVIASHNEGKVTEIEKLLIPLQVKVFSASKLGLSEPEETENTFEGNAKLKAKAAALKTNICSLADDSGLSIDALDGSPGVYSARWAGQEKDFSVAMKRINAELEKVELSRSTMTSKSAHFSCALALAWPNGETIVFEGRVDGQICWPPRGNKGFGYDPIFIPTGSSKTFGEVDQFWKHSVSHRADAFSKLLKTVYGKVDGYRKP